MYLYVTSNINNGHKIGITDNLLERKKQYNTIFPDIDFLLSVYSYDSVFIEDSFKKRFWSYRKWSSGGDRKSEIYTLYYQHIVEHIIRCHHSNGKALLIPDMDLDSEFYTVPDEGTTHYYLSNHYFIDFKKWKYVSLGGVSPRLRIGYIFQTTINHESIDQKDIDEGFTWAVSHISFDGFRKSLKGIIDKSAEHAPSMVPAKKWESDQSFGKAQCMLFKNYFHALTFLQENIFDILLAERIIKRPFSVNKLTKIKKQSGFMRYPLANYKEKIFFGKKFQTQKFNLGYNDEKRREIKRDMFVGKELIKYGKDYKE